MTDEPVYIPETHDFLQLRQFVQTDLLAKGVHKGHVDMAFKGLVGFKETSRYHLKIMCLKVYEGH